MLSNSISTVFGWQYFLNSMQRLNARSLRNFPMQANGAEMLRLACIWATEAGIKVCAPVHDAILIEAEIDDIEKEVQRTKSIMCEASAIVLDGFELESDAEVVRYPDYYVDERGEKMWQTIWGLIEAEGNMCASDTNLAH